MATSLNTKPLYIISALTAKALYHKETLCKKDEVQRFLSSLVVKKPEVGHLVNCFHMAKPTNSTTNTKGNVAKPVQTDGAKTGNQPKKVITFSTIDNFGYQSWRDFSDSRLIDPIMNGENPRLDSFGSGSIKSFVSKLSIDFEP